MSLSNKFVIRESKAYQTLDSPVMVGFFLEKINLIVPEPS